MTAPDDPAIDDLHSGTTGPPKGVACMGHRVHAGVHLPGMQMSHNFLPQAVTASGHPADGAWAGGY